ncbi:MAG TPA: hypothetical protein VFX09_06450 [Burkholderiales bacterium]|nr:hypothetical protein [Burkholderiales bacterium]
MDTSRIAQSRLEESLVSLFADYPELWGFSVLDRAELAVSDIGLYPPPPFEEAKAICEEIRDTLAALVDERPEARSLLAGRTFARRLH